MVQPPDCGTCLDEATREQRLEAYGCNRVPPARDRPVQDFSTKSSLATFEKSSATMALNGFLSSFIAAVQASLSVLLVISYGAVAAKLGLLNASNGKAISKICVKMLSPGILSKLLVERETTVELVARAKSYILVFATVSSCLTFAVGPRLIDTEHAPHSDDDLDA